MKNIKIEIHNEEHSKAVQERLFELGCGWNFGDKSLYHTEKNYLLTDRHGRITYIDDKDVFKKEATLKQVTLDDLYKTEVVTYVGKHHNYVYKKGDVLVSIEGGEKDRHLHFDDIKGFLAKLKESQND